MPVSQAIAVDIGGLDRHIDIGLAVLGWIAAQLLLDLGGNGGAPRLGGGWCWHQRGKGKDQGEEALHRRSPGF
jgi:hypothetical protein